jgi:hypothetical protein
MELLSQTCARTLGVEVEKASMSPTIEILHVLVAIAISGSKLDADMMVMVTVGDEECFIVQGQEPVR